VKRNASQLARASGTVLGKSFVGERIEFASLRVTIDRSVEPLRIECLRRISGSSPCTASRLAAAFAAG
jgi:hypothetical protein